MSISSRAVVSRLVETVASGELAALCERHDIDLLVLFGSARRGADDADDVDLALRFKWDTRGDVLAVLHDLHGLTGYEGFDVLDLGRAGPVARERALVGARLLHQAREGLFATTQISAIMETLDTDEMRRVELELMSR